MYGKEYIENIVEVSKSATLILNEHEMDILVSVIGPLTTLDTQRLVEDRGYNWDDSTDHAYNLYNKALSARLDLKETISKVESLNATL